ncbi:hypothetical protein SASC598P14_001220, partial [Snodgrassella alvi SCGC AB-598-P14]
MITGNNCGITFQTTNIAAAMDKGISGNVIGLFLTADKDTRTSALHQTGFFSGM